MLISRSASALLRGRICSASKVIQTARNRGLLTLAIETSCDDTSVAIVEKNDRSPDVSARIHFLENVTADTREYRGIHPILALESHQENLAKLVNKALGHLPRAAEDGEDTSKRINLSDGSERRKPDFISATRGPGMRANLFTGLDTAKGLSVAWQIPFVGVHHMQAHLLTPRLVSAMSRAQHGSDVASTNPPVTPEFPFLSILVSGGHSMLVESTSITEHTIMASTADIAIGESLDKAAREILPPSVLNEAKTTMYGRLLERFAFPNGSADWSSYCAPKSRGEELIKHPSPWGWTLTSPFANTRQLQFSFSFLPSMINKLMGAKKTAGEDVSNEERVALAREAMRVCFEHLGSRTIIALEELQQEARNKGVPEVKTLVISGGVAANRFLMAVLRSFLDVRGFGHIEIVAPPPYLCTDNAAMIGWAGIEMFEAGFSTDLGGRALRKWALDPRAEDGGLLGADGWMIK
ncbi:N(6)-L-threonylcarbamoyladenine synthase family protein [Aspergillus novofumigatus IBT 16806]|uniref:N(6)-L-threonylcarbamoyladenine synthase n=1 Tax=Aspergillus novofumigatus (strain IBT 16806) TaxID=1392255 RepID=A0A2I1BZB1_ASPN1|nr:glycoprotease family protein [Aspergillus novofumigatus IBT 16806]PKX90705.1 glycoprotease family protein [Aspergillus novofumigatus IBT 16806]